MSAFWTQPPAAQEARGMQQQLTDSRGAGGSRRGGRGGGAADDRAAQASRALEAGAAGSERYRHVAQDSPRAAGSGDRGQASSCVPQASVNLVMACGALSGVLLLLYGVSLMAQGGGSGAGAGAGAGPVAGGGGGGPVPPQPTIQPLPMPNLSPGTTVMDITNNEWSDGVVFCRGPVAGSLTHVFSDEALTQSVVKSELDCAVPSSPAALQWGEGVPGGATLAIGLLRGQTKRLYIAAEGTWPSGACWFQDAASNKKVSMAKGPQFMSEVEFTIEASGKGAVWYDMSSVEGVSGGITMNYTDDKGRTQTDVAVPGRFQGSTLKVVPAPGIGFSTVLSDKNFLGACTCNVWDAESPECNSDACFAGCPGSLVDNACGQHRCRAFYAKRYQDPASYCGWLYAEKAQTYCWAMDEWQCVDETCGYGGPDQPKADCTSPLPPDAAANTYSCGHGANMSAGTAGKFFWTEGAGCVDKMVTGVPTNPAPPRLGGRISISFVNLPWLHE